MEKEDFAVEYLKNKAFSADVQLSAITDAISERVSRGVMNNDALVGVLKYITETRGLIRSYFGDENE